MKGQSEADVASARDDNIAEYKKSDQGATRPNSATEKHDLVFDPFE